MEAIMTSLLVAVIMGVFFTVIAFIGSVIKRKVTGTALSEDQKAEVEKFKQAQLKKEDKDK